MTKGIELLRPYLVTEGVEEKGTVVIGTVKGDLDDIGKNLVRMMIEGKGLKVIDLGVDVPVEKYLDAARENNANIIACPALLTTTMTEVREVVEAVKASELNGKVKIMIGGARSPRHSAIPSVQTATPRTQQAQRMQHWQSAHRKYHIILLLWPLSG